MGFAATGAFTKSADKEEEELQFVPSITGIMSTSTAICGGATSTRKKQTIEGRHESEGRRCQLVGVRRGHIFCKRDVYARI